MLGGAVRSVLDREDGVKHLDLFVFAAVAKQAEKEGDLVTCVRRRYLSICSVGGPKKTLWGQEGCRTERAVVVKKGHKSRK